MTKANKIELLFFTLVHPDFLPPVYAFAQALQNLNYSIHILTFDSLISSNQIEMGPDIVIESLGKHHDVPLVQRLKLRKNFKRRATALVNKMPKAIFTFCSFSYITAIEVAKHIPVAYHALEVDDFAFSSLPRSPLSQINSYRALKLIHKAALVTTPSAQRSAWLAGRARLQSIPKTILNCTYHSESRVLGDVKDQYQKLVPKHFIGKRTIIYTGAVNERLCVFELVRGFDLLNDPDCVLIVTGFKNNDYCRQITEFVASCQTKNNIQLMPYVTREEMLTLQANAQIGACFNREYKGFKESQMIAPNKVGEYLSMGLFLIGNDSYFMSMFAMNGVATLSRSVEPVDIMDTLQSAINATKADDNKEKIRKFVAEIFNMQQQIKPVIEWLSGIV